MATIAARLFADWPQQDVLSGTRRAHAIDRWIYVIMAVLFVAIVLAGFIPDSLTRLAMVKAHQAPPFPKIVHVHAVLMGSFMALLLAQTVLVATDRCSLHKRFGLTAMVLAPALVVVGFFLPRPTYLGVWQAAHNGPPPVQAMLTPVLRALENILLLQTRIGILFSLFLVIGLWARARDAGLHKRMMILATAVTLPAAFARIPWLPQTQNSPMSLDLYVLLAVSPMLAWDVVRNRSVHRAYVLWLPIYAAASLTVYLMWDRPWWHVTARQIIGV